MKLLKLLILSTVLILPLSGYSQLSRGSDVFDKHYKYMTQGKSSGSFYYGKRLGSGDTLIVAVRYTSSRLAYQITYYLLSGKDLTGSQVGELKRMNSSYPFVSSRRADYQEENTIGSVWLMKNKEPQKDGSYLYMYTFVNAIDAIKQYR